MSINTLSSPKNVSPAPASATISSVSPEHIDLFSAGTPEEIQPSVEIIAKFKDRVQAITEPASESKKNGEPENEQPKKASSKITGADMF